MRILVVEDDPVIAASIAQAITSPKANMVPTLVSDGRHAESMLFQARRSGHTFDAVVLDLTLPGMDGLDVLRQVRRTGDTTPVLVLTARVTLADKVEGLETGADDYLAKPFESEELVARIRAIARRKQEQPKSEQGVGNLTYDVGRGVFMVDGAYLKLPPRQHVILDALIRRPGVPLSKELLTNLDSEGASPGSVDTQMSRLRRFLKEMGADVSITTLHGVGYVLEPSKG